MAKKILVVDNSPTMLKIMKRLLRDMGHHVVTAADGLSALGLLEHFIPDVVFIDLIMPNISGDKLCWIIRGMEQMQHVKLVILSAIAAEERSRFEDINADAWIAKGPPKKMVANIEAVLKGLERDDNAALSRTVIGLEDLHQRQITSELLTYRRHLGAILENMGEGIVEITLDGRIVYANQFAVSLSGIPEERLLGSEFPMLFTGMDRQIIRSTLDEMEGVDEKTSFDSYFKLNSNAVELTLIPMNDNGLKSIIAILYDISNQKQAEIALQNSEAKYKTILENIEEGFYEIDLEGNFTFVNESVCRMLGYEREELLGMNHRRYTSKETARELRRVFKQIFQSGKPAKAGNYEIIAKDGNKWMIQCSAYLIHDDQGHPVGFRGIARDIMEQLKLDRENKLLEEQLRQAQKMEAVGTLAGGIAHDFNNILQAISGYTQLLMLKSDPQQPEYVRYQAIEKAAASGGELIKRLMIFSRKVESELRSVNLNEEITHISELLKRTLPKMIDIELNLGEDIQMISADSVQLEQIVVNMAVNARFAMPEGGRLVFKTDNVVLDNTSAKACLGAQPGKYVRLVIADTGHGMDQHTITRIFEPFYTTKKNGEGTGLGLAMVYGIVKSHGGYITCQSKFGKGTTFTIYFPVAAGATHQGLCAEEKKQALVNGAERILVVDDDNAILAIQKEILEAHGYSAVVASNGETALKIFEGEKNQIDLVILDIDMPGIGGYKCLEKMLNIDPQASVIITSGHAGAGMENKCLEAGAKGFVAKPHPIEGMLTKIRDIMSLQQQSSIPN